MAVGNNQRKHIYLFRLAGGIGFYKVLNVLYNVLAKIFGKSARTRLLFNLAVKAVNT